MTPWVAVAALLISVGEAALVTPVEKVVHMLEDLSAKVLIEGKREATTYDTFACFCKDTINEKTDAIGSGQDTADSLEAAIGSFTSDRSDLDVQVAELNTKILSLAKAEKDERQRRHEERETYQKVSLELSRGDRDLANAINTVKYSGDPQLLQLRGGAKTLLKAVASSATLGVEPKQQKHRQVLAALLRQTQTEDLQLHSGDITETLNDLKDDFVEKIADKKREDVANKHAYDVFMQANGQEREMAEKDLSDANELKSKKMELIAQNTKELTATKATLTDDQKYLQELSEICNRKSAEWSQRSTMRQGELTALTTALSVMKETVQPKETKLMQGKAISQDKSQNLQAAEDSDEDEVDVKESVSFAQLDSPHHRLNVIARKASASKGKVVDKHEGTTATRSARAMSFLKSRATTLGSQMLFKVVSEASSDPFAKIKTLLQELIERMMQESSDEATHKGWCDKETGKAKQMRQSKAENIARLNGDLGANEVKREKLRESSADLEGEISELQASLSKLDKERQDESGENAATINDAEEGKTAVEDAIKVLTDFYSTAGKAEEKSELLQQPKQPEDSSQGPYKGDQAASGGIIGMLEVIRSDFERAIQTTQTNERTAAQEFAEWETETKVSIGTKTTANTDNQAELADLVAAHQEDRTSLEQEIAMLDKSIQELGELRPACVDTGMSYADHVAKRREEIDALNEGLCILDGGDAC